MKNTLFALLALSPLSQAAVLAEYTFDNDGSGQDLSSSDVDINSTAADFTSGSLTIFTNASLETAFTSGGAGFDTTNGDDLAGAITAEQYFSFTVTAAAGYVLDLDDLNFDSISGGNGADDYYIFSDVGGFTSGAELLQVSGGGANLANSVDLTGAAFQGLSSIEFRVYVDDGNGTSSGSATQLDNVVLNGDAILVPEPSSVTLLGLGGLALVLRRRR